MGRSKKKSRSAATPLQNSRLRKRILTTAPPGAILLGCEPLRCSWRCPGYCGPPKFIYWALDDDDGFVLHADDIRVTPNLPLLSLMLRNQRRFFELLYHGSNPEVLFLDIVVSVLPWPNATYIMSALYEIDYSSVNEAPEEISSEAAWVDFFKELRNAQHSRKRAVVAKYQDPHLVPVLRGYQADAVEWMISREVKEESLDLDWLNTVADTILVRGGSPLVYNKYSKMLTECPERTLISKGGILADEMGLGKTVITLALVLSNKRVMLHREDEGSHGLVSDACESKSKGSKNRSRRIASSEESNDDEEVLHNKEKEDKDETHASPKQGGHQRKWQRIQMAKKEEVVHASGSKSKVVKKRPRRVASSEDSDDDEWVPHNEEEEDEEEMNAEPQQVIRQRKRRRTKSLKKEESSNYEKNTQRVKNQESCLSPDEKLQLVPNKGGSLRSHLNAWYESKLAEFSCVRVSNARCSTEEQFRCICGAEEDEIPRDSVACPQCNFYQHRSCVSYSPSNEYLCPACWKAAPQVESAATLIVAPPAIFEQWGSEIERHTPGLKLFLYNGVNRDKYVQPSHLAEYDVVVTTYPVLSAETLLTEDAPERSLRQESRYLRLSTPLTCISWWRIVCDEAQLVESDVSRVCQMVQQLSAVNRWSVTGTPIQRGIADLFYLTQFIGVGPFNDKLTWINFLLKPYLAGCKAPLLSILNQVFWRSSKESVVDELGLPEQSFIHHYLNFSAIEQTFYMQEHSKCSSKFAEGISKALVTSSRTLASIHKSILNKLLQPFLNLRQACTHPQVVSGVTIGSATGAANLSELLTYLSRKTKTECEDLLRYYISTKNGIAGLHILRFEWGQAIASYREVLSLAEQYSETLQVDSCLRIHALTNAAEVLEANDRDVISPTLRDETLRSEAEALEQEYRSKIAKAFKSSIAEAASHSAQIVDILKCFESAPDAWWLPVVLQLKDYENDLIDKLQIELTTNDEKGKSVKDFVKKLTTLRAVEVVIGKWWSSVEKERKQVLKAMSRLTKVPALNLVDPAIECHLRTNIKSGRQCDLCKVEQILLDLECALFATDRKMFRLGRHGDTSLMVADKKYSGAETKYSWKPNLAEKALLIIVNFAKSKQLLPKWCHDDAKQFIRLVESMKKEFKQLRTAWSELNHVVQAEDELAMSKLRLRFPLPGEEKKPRYSSLDLTQHNKTETNHVIDPHQVDSTLVTLMSEAVAYFSMFKKKYGQMLYLKNLGERRSAIPDPCPVCKTALDERWSVLQCGHCFCIECIQIMCRRQVICPICRETTESAGISFVDTRKQDEAQDDILVLGDFSTKVDAVVRAALRLLREDCSTKILIFSTWIEVLKILQKALSLNNVSNVFLASASRQQTLQKFRDPSSDITVLLLPLKMGSKGLNLTEATHVFLVEPILNPAEELQAIGRVHRIGQSKPTVVHRFLVKGTIEEKIHSTFSEAPDKWTNNEVTLGDLQNLFIVSQQSDAD